jgi:hypothetical protein
VWVRWDGIFTHCHGKRDCIVHLRFYAFWDGVILEILHRCCWVTNFTQLKLNNSFSPISTQSQCQVIHLLQRRHCCPLFKPRWRRCLWSTVRQSMRSGLELKSIRGITRMVQMVLSLVRLVDCWWFRRLAILKIPKHCGFQFRTV